MQAKAKSFKADKKNDMVNYRDGENRNEKEVRRRVIFSLRLRNIAYTCITDSRFALTVHLCNYFREVLICRTFSQSGEETVVCACVCSLWWIRHDARVSKWLVYTGLNKGARIFILIA